MSPNRERRRHLTGEGREGEGGGEEGEGRGRGRGRERGGGGREGALNYMIIIFSEELPSLGVVSRVSGLLDPPNQQQHTLRSSSLGRNSSPQVCTYMSLTFLYTFTSSSAASTHPTFNLSLFFLSCLPQLMKQPAHVTPVVSTPHLSAGGGGVPPRRLSSPPAQMHASLTGLMISSIHAGVCSIYSSLKMT